MRVHRIVLLAGLAMLLSCHNDDQGGDPGTGSVLGQTETPPPEWIVTSNPGSGVDWPFSAAFEPLEDALFVGGIEWDVNKWIWRIEKRKATDGSLISSFGDQGVVREVTTQYQWNGVECLAVDAANGHLYVAGFSHAEYGHQGNVQWRLEKRSLLDGSLVTSFGTGGIVLTNPSSDWDATSRIVLSLPEGALYVTGNDHAVGHFRWRVEKRSLENGSLVSAFGTGGVVTSDPGGDSFPGPIVLHPAEGTFFVGGNDQATGANNSRWRIEKRKMTDGSLVPEFANSGVVWVDLGGGPDSVGSLDLDPATGSLFAGGFDAGNGASDLRWRIEKRKIGNGSYVDAFGQGGVITSNPSDGAESFASLFVDTERNVFFFGGTVAAPNEIRIEKRNLSDGALAAGALTLPPLGSGATLIRLAQGPGDGTIFFVAHDSLTTNDQQWRIQRIKL